MLSNILAVMVGLPLVAVVATFYLALYGAAFMVLWDWFIVPLGPKPLSISHAIGINLFIWLCLGVRDDKRDDDAADGWEISKGIIRSVMRPVVAVAVGFALKTFGTL